MEKRIFYVSNHLRGQNSAAGTRSWQQAKVLSENFFVTVAVPATDPVTTFPVTPDTYAGLDAEKVDVRLVRTIKLDRSRKWKRVLFYVSSGLGQFVQGLKSGKVDCVLSMSLPVTSLWVAFLLSRLKRCPLVVDVRDLPFETAAEMGYLSQGRLTSIAIKLETYVLKRAAAIICNSPRYKPMLEARGIPGARIEVAMIGYDDFPAPDQSQVDETRERLTAEFSESPPAKIGVYCGTFGHVVEVEAVLRAAELLKDDPRIGFVLIGAGQRLDEYKKIVAEKNLNVHFTGRVTKKDVQLMCRASDFCLYAAKPGKMSAAMLGNKVFDYLGAEKPVMYVGPDSAVSDVLKQVDAGIILPPDDAKGLAEKLTEFLDMPELQERLAQNAAKFREHGFTAPASARRLSRRIAEVIGKST